MERLGELLTEAGLVVEERVRDWDRSPVTPDSAEIISVVRGDSGSRVPQAAEHQVDEGGGLLVVARGQGKCR
ncbi:hypothetical protein [Kutzneria kofuensis]|uniref:hypothetical protein n=1 Tax=Kutzneria kofuensis TaxID=103725 RepID=UPI0031EE4EFF